MDTNKLISTLTFAGLFGAVLLNWRGANELLQTLGNVGTSYVSTVRGPAPAY